MKRPVKTAAAFAVLAIVVVLVLLVAMPLNRFLPVADELGISALQPLHVSSGELFVQVPGSDDIWQVRYELCAGLNPMRWCVDANSGEQHAKAIVEWQGGYAVTLTDVAVQGDSTMLRQWLAPNMGSFGFSGSAQQIEFDDVRCPGRGMLVRNAVVDVESILVMGTPLRNARIAVDGDPVVAAVSGSAEGEIVLVDGQFRGLIKAPNLPPNLAMLLGNGKGSGTRIGKSAVRGWNVEGSLPCLSQLR